MEERLVPLGWEPQERKGAKYNKRLTLKEIAAAIRADVKAAKKAGELPADVKVSVRMEHGTAIDVQWKGAGVYALVRVGEWNHRFGNCGQRFGFALNEKGQRIQKVLEGIHGAYNRDASDPMVDYFDVRFYGRVQVDWREQDRPELWQVEEAAQGPVLEAALVFRQDGLPLDEAIDQALLLDGGAVLGLGDLALERGGEIERVALVIREKVAA